MKIPLSCPHASYKTGMRIWCAKTGSWCGNQYFKACKGWWALTERAALCPIRKKEINPDE